MWRVFEELGRKGTVLLLSTQRYYAAPNRNYTEVLPRGLLNAFNTGN